jgi:hypothetical protein
MRKESDFTNYRANSYTITTFILFLATVLAACGQMNVQATQTLSPISTAPTAIVNAQPDSTYYQFGKIFPVEMPKDLDIYNPHQVAQYSVLLLEQGRTEELLNQIGHVEKDAQLGQSFLTFLREFGPDLVRYKGKNIFLKFEGMHAGKDTSIWYYYLVDNKGNYLDDKSWISLHRSNADGRCALTGIFLNLPEFGEAVTMPGDILKS